MTGAMIDRRKTLRPDRRVLLVVAALLGQGQLGGLAHGGGAGPDPVAGRVVEVGLEPDDHVARAAEVLAQVADGPGHGRDRVGPHREPLELGPTGEGADGQGDRARLQRGRQAGRGGGPG